MPNKKTGKEQRYRCKCLGECSKDIPNLGRCIMRSYKEDTYCTYCESTMLDNLKKRLRSYV